MSVFIGSGHENLEEGDVGFLVERTNNVTNGSSFSLNEHPAVKNLSGESVLCGWCGTTNDVGVYAHGMAKVVRVCKNGRAQVADLEGEELKAALEEYGYPELLEE